MLGGSGGWEPSAEKEAGSSPHSPPALPPALLTTARLLPVCDDKKMSRVVRIES